MKGDITLNIILQCSKCGLLIEGEMFSDNVRRMNKTPFPKSVRPFTCEACLENRSYEECLRDG